MYRPRTTTIPPNMAGMPSRRDLLRSLAGLGLGLGTAAYAEPGSARKRRRKKRKNKQKIKRNYFGCVDVGQRCEKAGQCCSGICTGSKRKKTCQSHNQITCQPGASICVPPYVECVTKNGDASGCGTTTGNAGYCATRGDCFPCRRDVDCEPFYGEGAACGICAQCGVTSGTVCLGIMPFSNTAQSS